MSRFTFSTQVCLFGAVLAFGSVLANASVKSFIGPLKVTPGSSTVPANGDVNPYGVAVVPRSTGKLVRDHVLVSNFGSVQESDRARDFSGVGVTAKTGVAVVAVGMWKLRVWCGFPSSVGPTTTLRQKIPP